MHGAPGTSADFRRGTNGGFPTIAEVIDELYQWWLEHRDDTLVYF